jgi:hypothetical protein
MDHKQFWTVFAAVIVANVAMGAAILLLNKKVHGSFQPNVAKPGAL